MSKYEILPVAETLGECNGWYAVPEVEATQFHVFDSGELVWAADTRSDAEQFVREASAKITGLAETCTYPRCKCIVSTSTSRPEPVCPRGLERA